MNILILCCLPEEYDNSSMLCVSLLCKGFVECGHNVAIATPEPDENNIYYNPNHHKIENIIHLRFGKRIKKQKSDNSKVVKTGKLKAMLLGIYRKFDLFGKSILSLKFSDELLNKIKNNGFVPDIIISTSDPKSSHLLSNKIKKKKEFSVPFVQYWGDPLTMDIASHSILPLWIKRIIESSIIKKADVVAYVSPLTAIDQKKLFKRYAKKMIYSPTPCETNEYDISNNDYTIGYFGSYNSTVRNIIPLYEALKKNTTFHLLIVGDSDIKLESTPNIEIISRIPANELDAYYCRCSVIVDLMNNRGGQIPAKLFRDAGTNKELLLISDSERAHEIIDYFGQFNRYTICNNTVEDILSALERYKVQGIPLRSELKEFEYRTVAKKLIEDIIKCTERE